MARNTKCFRSEVINIFIVYFGGEQVRMWVGTKVHSISYFPLFFFKHMIPDFSLHA